MDCSPNFIYPIHKRSTIDNLQSKMHLYVGKMWQNIHGERIVKKEYCVYSAFIWKLQIILNVDKFNNIL